MISKREYDLDRKNKDPKWYWSTESIRGHIRRGIEVRVSQLELYNYVLKIDQCQDCGTVLAWGYGNGQSSETPTCDRRNNDGILELGNIAIICHRCTATKHDRTLKDWVLLRDHKLRRCPRCRQLKPLGSFNILRQKGRYFRPDYCKVCKNELNRQNYRTHREKRLASMREYQRLHKSRLHHAEPRPLQLGRNET